MTSLWHIETEHKRSGWHYPDETHLIFVSQGTGGNLFEICFANRIRERGGERERREMVEKKKRRLIQDYPALSLKSLDCTARRFPSARVALGGSSRGLSALPRLSQLSLARPCLASVQASLPKRPDTTRTASTPRQQTDLVMFPLSGRSNNSVDAAQGIL